jgi:putative transcriptional regulator
MKKLDNHMRRCRFEKNEMTQEELARAVGVTRQTIHSIEKGKFIPSAYLAIKISRIFGKSVEDLFFLTEENNETRKDERDEKK